MHRMLQFRLEIQKLRNCSIKYSEYCNCSILQLHHWRISTFCESMDLPRVSVYAIFSNLLPQTVVNIVHISTYFLMWYFHSYWYKNHWPQDHATSSKMLPSLSDEHLYQHLLLILLFKLGSTSWIGIHFGVWNALFNSNCIASLCNGSTYC